MVETEARTVPYTREQHKQVSRLGRKRIVYSLIPSNLRMMESMKVLWGTTCPLLTGMLSVLGAGFSGSRRQGAGSARRSGRNRGVPGGHNADSGGPPSHGISPLASGAAGATTLRPAASHRSSDCLLHSGEMHNHVDGVGVPVTDSRHFRNAFFFFLYGATTAARAAGVTFKTTVLRGRTFGPVVTATPFRPGSAERGEEEVGFSRAARDGDIRVLPECRVPTRKRIVSCSLQMDTEEQERTQLRWLRPRQLTVVAARANHAAKPGAPHADGGAASRTPGKTRARVSNSRDGGVSVSTAFRARGAL